MERPAVRRELPLLLELSGLCGLAVALPALDVLGHSPDFLVLERLDASDLVLLAALVALVPPLALEAAGVLTGLAGPLARRAAHLATVAGLLAALAVQVGKHLTPLRGRPLAVAAVLAALAGTALYRRLPALAPVLRVAAPAPLLAAGIFLLASPASNLVLPDGDTPAARPAQAGEPAAGRPPIVVVAFDELPLTSLLDTSGRVDPATYPSFAWLAGHSTWYRNATAVTQWTRDAFPAMLTGRYPSRALPAHHRSYPDNLFTLLDGPYQLDVHETSTMLCPRHCSAGAAQPARRPAGAGPWRALRRSCALVAELASPWEREQQPTAQFEQPVVPTTAPPGHAGTAASRPAGWAEFLDGLTPDAPGPSDSPGDHPAATPRLHYLHLLLPHRPWRALPSGLRYPEPPRTLGLATKGASWGDEAAWTRLALERHRLQLAWADRLLGEVLTTLRATGLYQRALVVVTADHGISFRPGTHPRVIGRDNAPGIMWVPLFVKEPGQRRPRVDDRNWEHVDLLPTLAGHAQLQVPWPVDGRSALGPPRTTSAKRFLTRLRPDEPPQAVAVDGPPNQAMALRGGLPRRPGARARLGAEPGRGLARPGVRPDLAGRPLAGLAVRDGGGPPATVEGLDAFANVRPSRGEVPALVAGLPPPGTPAGTRLALALNGRVATVAEVAPEGRDHVLRFAGMLGGEGFVAGPNRLEVLVVTDDGLRRLSLRGG
jgi:arylsulfatase A-like enzyme